MESREIFLTSAKWQFQLGICLLKGEGEGVGASVALDSEQESEELFEPRSLKSYNAQRST
jgi:hypothetical protein